MTKNGLLAYIGVGSNLGDSVINCREAIRRLSEVSGVTVERLSSFYRTEPVSITSETPFSDSLQRQNWFVNAAVEIRTILFPDALLRVLQEIEKTMGRVRTVKGAPRIIDLDILLYDQEVISETDLIIPHSEMHKRLFVLEPMCEIASYAIHPGFGISMRGLKDRLDDSKKVEKMEEKEE